MAMAMMSFHFDEPLDHTQWRALLKAQVGRWRADEHNIELSPSDDHIISLLTQDMVAMVYGAKVMLALGGRHLPMTFGEPATTWRPPDWAKTPWVKLPLLRRIKLWIGPTKTYG